MPTVIQWSHQIERSRLRILACAVPGGAQAITHLPEGTELAFAVPATGGELAAAPSGAAQASVRLRWASDPALGFPTSGYHVFREVAGATRAAGGPSLTPIQGSPFFCPDTSSWQAFAADVAARKPSGVTWFPSVTQAELAWLMDPIRLCDPRTSQSEVPGLVTKVAGLLDEPHREDPNLAAAIWGVGTPLTLATLMATPSWATLLTAFYREQAIGFLWMLALRPAYAAVFGLFAEDQPPPGTIGYHVFAELPQAGWRRDQETDLGECSPPPPGNLRLWRADGVTRHPEFSRWPGWLPDPALARPPLAGTPWPPDAYVPKYSTRATALAWDAPLQGAAAAEPTFMATHMPVEGTAPPPAPDVIDYGPYLYDVERHEHGAATAAQATEPAFPAGPFALTHPGSQVMKKVHPSDGKGPGPGGAYADHIDMRESRHPELEGWVAYRVWGVNLFGNRSASSANGQLRHHDDVPPPAPLRAGRSLTLAESGGSYVLPAAATKVDLNLELGWDDRTDLMAPDASEFRVYAGWAYSRYWECQVTSVQKLSELRSRLAIAGGVTGFATDELKGLRITLGSWDYTIKTNTTGPSGYLETTNRNGQPPPAGPGLVLYFDELPETLTHRVAVVQRPARLAAKIGSSTPTGNEHDFDLIPESGVSFAAFASGALYIHALGHSVRVKSRTANKVRVVPPSGAGAEWWSEWRALASPDAAVAGSPAILYPDATATISVPKPSAFGTLAKLGLAVSAADNASYVSEGAGFTAPDASLLGRKGNESQQTPLPAAMLISDTPPGKPTTPPYDPSKVIWARPAFDYREEARYEVKWTAQPGMRYQVGRASDAALAARDHGPFAQGTVVRELDLSAYTDAQIRTFAASASNEDLFVPIGPPAIIGGAYEDHSIPGKSGGRVVYRVRAIDEANRPGPWSDVIGPVHVPLITAPATPSLRDVIAENPGEVTVRWSHTGIADDLVFEVYRAGDWKKATDHRRMTRVAQLDQSDPDLRDDGRGAYAWIDDSLIPGWLYHYRVRALRRVQDPADATGATKRDIASQASEAVAGQAYAGPLASPEWTSAAWSSASGKVALKWANKDAYERIDVLHRELGRPAWRPLASELDGAMTQTTLPLPAGKRFDLLLRAFAIGRTADSAIQPVDT
jgi:hypothetical protein